MSSPAGAFVQSPAGAFAESAAGVRGGTEIDCSAGFFVTGHGAGFFGRPWRVAYGRNAHLHVTIHTSGVVLVAGAAFDALRQAVIDAFTGPGVQPNGWEAEVRPALVVGDVTRFSATELRIALGDLPAYRLPEGTSEAIADALPATLFNPPSTALLRDPLFIEAGDGEGAAVVVAGECAITLPELSDAAGPSANGQFDVIDGDLGGRVTGYAIYDQAGSPHALGGGQTLHVESVGLNARRYRWVGGTLPFADGEQVLAYLP